MDAMGRHFKHCPPAPPAGHIEPAPRTTKGWLKGMHQHFLRVLLGALLCSPLTATWPQVDPRTTPEPGSAWLDKPEQTFTTRAIVTAHPLATQAGWQMLQQGGSAVDAAIAAQLVLTLVEPQSSGLGGGAFMLLAQDSAVSVLDGRETAPQDVTEQLFLQPDGRPMAWGDAVKGGRAVGTPGVLRMLSLAHQQHGRLPWERLFQPAIALAEQGFAISARLHQAIRQAEGLREDPMARALYYNAQGDAWPEGHLLRNPALAHTLRRIAREGVGAFYEGPLADAVVARVRQHATNPGYLRTQDLAAYQAVTRAALCHRHTFGGRSYRICGAPPPSSGGLTVSQILGLLEHAPLWTQLPPATALPSLPDITRVHLFTEASRLAYADRSAYIADPSFIPAPAGDWASLLAPDYLQQRALALPTTPSTPSMQRAPAGNPGPVKTVWAPMPEQPELGTTHLSVVDGRGQAVSLTSSIESSFGARLMVGGFVLNNQLTDFSFIPRDAQGHAVANRVEPGKRPRSSMSPTLVFDDQDQRLLAVLGSPGGALIIPYVAQTLLALLHEQRPPQQAVSLPHIASLNGPTLLEADRFPHAWQQALRALGAPVHTQPMASGLHVLFNVGTPEQPRWATGIDPRREGAAAGD